MSEALIYDLQEGQKRQFIDAETVFLAQRQARDSALAEVRGSMFWRDLRGVRTLIRASARGAQKSLGPESPQTLAVYESFVARKAKLQGRHKALSSQLLVQTRLNRALRVGRVPNIVVQVLKALDAHGLHDKFMVVGTHAMFAYEAAAGVRIGEAAVATRDVGILFDTRKNVAFFTALSRIDSSLIGIFRKVDPSFEVVSDQLQTARNQDGFEIDVIRRVASEADPHPLRMSRFEDDFWACQIPSGESLLSARKFEQTVVSTSGDMALMRTVHPIDFARIKTALASHRDREPLKRAKDLLQAKIALQIVDVYLPHLRETVGAPASEGEAPGAAV